MPFVEITIHIIPAPLRKVTSPSDLLAELFLDPDLTQFNKNGTGEFKNSISLLTWLMETEVILVAAFQTHEAKIKGTRWQGGSDKKL